jgi:metal-dependent amidase/aminoacylase/carboxypeptidase family protein
MRWSEDFGHFLKHIDGAYFGIGAGEDYPVLHTKEYDFPDSLLPMIVALLMKLSQEG